MAIGGGGTTTNVILKFGADTSDLEKAARKARSTVESSMGAMTKATVEASKAQEGLTTQITAVSKSLEEGQAAADSWAKRLGTSFTEAFGKFEKGAHKLGDAMNTVGEVFSKADRAAKAFGLQLDPMIGQFAEIAQGVGQLAMEAAKLPAIIRGIVAASATSGGVAAGVLGAGAAAVGSLGYIGYRNYQFIDEAAKGFTNTESARWAMNYARTGDESILDILSGENQRKAEAMRREYLRYEEGMGAYDRAVSASVTATGYAYGGLGSDFELPEERARGGGGRGDPYRNLLSRRGLRSGEGAAPIGGYDLGYGSLGIATGGGHQAYGIDAPGAMSGAQAAANATASLSGLSETYLRLSEQIAADHEKGVLRAVFGDPKEFSEFATQMELVSGAFNAFSQAITASFSAWTSGQQTAIEVARQFPKALLQNGATMLLGESLKHAAMGVGSWAWGDVPGAVKHKTAALTLGGAALAVGGLARLLGGSGGGSSAGYNAGSFSGGAPNVIGNGYQQQQPNEPRLVVVGDTWADDNFRVRRAAHARLHKAARRELETTRGAAYR